MSQGNFFAIGCDEFASACEMGMRPAVSLLVMARGTGKDNRTTKWSAQAVFQKTGIAWRRAQEAIETLVAGDLVEVKRAGKHPLYKLRKPEDDSKLIWLPNELIDGAGNEVPPVTKLREKGNLELLEKYIQLYAKHDIDNDGGLPRSIAWRSYTRERICPIGPYMLYGFQKKETYARAAGLLSQFSGVKDEAGNQGAWIVLSPLLSLGLLELVSYVVESDDPDSELIYPVNNETNEAIDTLQNWLEETDGNGFARQISFYDETCFVPKHIEEVAMVGIYRMTYRPKTGKTSRWWAMERERTEAMINTIGAICTHKGKVVDIKACKGTSRDIKGYQIG